MKIVLFIFSWSNDENEIYSFKTPQEAIEFFTAQGYGMHNWKISVKLDDMYDSTTSISLLMFNYITDH